MGLNHHSTMNITTEIRIGPCLIQVIGNRSRKGWEVRFNGHLQGERPTKRKALQLAQDTAEPGTSGTITVKPKQPK
jgi:hypothetical protein